jgi:hypothetical protein
MFRHRRDPMVVDGHDTNPGRRATMMTDTTAVVLIGMHLVVGAVVIVGFARYAPGPG